MQWEGAKQDGKKVMLLDETKQVSTTPQNLGGKTVLLGTWKLTKQQIEDKLGINIFSGSQNFKSLQEVRVAGTLKFKQGTAPLVWDWNGMSNLISYTLRVESTNPLAITGGQKVELNVDYPEDRELNLKGNRVVRLTATLDKWTQEQGSPTLKLFYTDPKVTDSVRNTPLFIKGLSPTTTTTEETKFTIGYAFGQNAQQGQYTFELSSKGRTTVAKESINVVSIPIIKPTPVECTPPLVKQTDGSCVNPNPPEEPPEPPIVVCEGETIASCVDLPDIIQWIFDNKWIVFGFIIFLIIMVTIASRSKSL